MSEILITVCDKCPADAETRATSRATFQVDGKSYVVDVCDEHGREIVALTAELEAWAAIATPTPRRPAGRTRKEPDPDPAVPVTNDAGEAHVNDIRSWARSQGLVVADRGRIAEEIVSAYNASHPGTLAPTG